MRRVLMVCYYFPPLGGIGSVRALKFAHYLPEFGWDPTVIAPRNGAYHRDPTLEFDETKVVRTASLEMSRTGKQIMGSRGGDTRPAEVGPLLKGVQDVVRRWLYRPDPQIGWYPFAVRRVRRLLRRQKFDAIFSSSFPITAHLVARRVHRESGIPWVAEFRDLWTHMSRYDSRRRRRLDEATEQELLATATEVVTVSEGYAKILSDRGARRVSVISNGFDPVDFQGTPRSGRPVATYVGTYYPDRQDLGPTLQALGELTTSGLLPGLGVRFVGEFPEALREQLLQSGLSHGVECTGFVPHREALAYMEDSTLLLLAGPVPGVFPESMIRGNIASKVFEYLGSRRPILYVGEAGSDVERIIRGLPGVECVHPRDAEGIRRAIVFLVRQGLTIDRRPLHVYTRQSLTGRLAGVLDVASGRATASVAPPRGMGGS